CWTGRSGTPGAAGRAGYGCIPAILTTRARSRSTSAPAFASTTGTPVRSRCLWTCPCPGTRPRHERMRSAAGSIGVDLQHHAVVGGLDALGQTRLELVVIELVVHVGQDRVPGLDALDPGERLLEMSMGRVRPLAQAVDQPDLDAGQLVERCLRQLLDVGRIGERARAESPARQPPVALLERAERQAADPKRSVDHDR